jgi:hypothetical protein
VAYQSKFPRKENSFWAQGCGPGKTRLQLVFNSLFAGPTFQRTRGPFGIRLEETLLRSLVLCFLLGILICQNIMVIASAPIVIGLPPAIWCDVLEGS